MINLLNLDQEDLAAFFTTLGEKSFRATQVLQWIHQVGITDFDKMTNLSKSLRQRLQLETCLAFPTLVNQQISQDGTYKWLLQLDNNNYIETVFIPEDDRGTLCISSQIGCALECSFCATGKQGFNRNLTVGEIIGQLWLAEQTLRQEEIFCQTNPNRAISNVVLMGMGEPLANFNNVVKAVKLMQNDFCYGLSWRRVTISTAGIVPAISRLKTQCSANLAISLHAPNDELRNQLVPINKKYPLNQLMAACRDYVNHDARCRITFEYVMLKEVNDTPAHARALLKLLRGIPAKINLIPFNPFAGSTYQRSTPEAIEQFRDILMQADVLTVTRKTRGDDIDAACGQLAGKIQNRRQPMIFI